MIDVNECKVPAYVVGAFSIVRQNLSDVTEFDWEVLLEKAHLSEVNPFPIDNQPQQEGDYMSQEEFLSHLKGEKTPIVMGLSQPRVIAIEPDPVVEISEYQAATLNDSADRPVLGLNYIPTQKWAEEDSMMVYLRLLADMSDKDFMAETQSKFYKLMFEKLVKFSIVDGVIDPRFAKLLVAEKRGWEINRMVVGNVHKGFVLFFSNTRQIRLGEGEGSAA